MAIREDISGFIAKVYYYSSSTVHKISKTKLFCKQSHLQLNYHQYQLGSAMILTSGSATDAFSKGYGVVHVLSSQRMIILTAVTAKSLL